MVENRNSKEFRQFLMSFDIFTSGSKTDFGCGYLCLPISWICSKWLTLEAKRIISRTIISIDFCWNIVCPVPNLHTWKMESIVRCKSTSFIHFRLKIAIRRSKLLFCRNNFFPHQWSFQEDQGLASWLGW